MHTQLTYSLWTLQLTNSKTCNHSVSVYGRTRSVEWTEPIHKKQRITKKTRNSETHCISLLTVFGGIRTACYCEDQEEYNRTSWIRPKQTVYVHPVAPWGTKNPFLREIKDASTKTSTTSHAEQYQKQHPVTHQAVELNEGHMLARCRPWY
jgi:hypothetical protein